MRNRNHKWPFSAQAGVPVSTSLHASQIPDLWISELEGPSVAL